MPEPSWLGNAQAGLIDAAILGLPVVWWKARSRWARWPAFVVWALAVSVVVYHTIKGNLWTLVPPFVISQFPGWGLIIAFMLGALAGGAAIRFGNRRAQELPAEPPPVEISPKVEIDTHKTLWQTLNPNEREALESLWNRAGQFLFLYQLDWRDRWGVPEYNAAIHNLKQMGLIVEGLRRPPGSSSILRTMKTIHLTSKGATLMTWHSRREASPDPPAPSADPLLNTPAATIRYGLMWPEIGTNEREFLALLWAQPDTFAPNQLVQALERKWGVPTFNAATHSLRALKLIDHWNHGTKGPGWSLTGAGRDLMTWREKQPKTE